MKKFKAKIAIMAIVALAAISGAGAMASTASAANCSASTSTTYFDLGKLKFDAHLFSCSGIDKVRFYSGGFWQDVTWNQVKVADEAGAIINTTSSANYTYSKAPWCAGATHTVWTDWGYAIHNTAGGGSWGTQHLLPSGQYNIVC